MKLKDVHPASQISAHNLRKHPDEHHLPWLYDLHHVRRHNAAAQHTEQMEELCDRHQNVSRAIQIELRDDRIVVRPMFKRLARNQPRGVGGRNVKQVNVVAIRAVEEVSDVLRCIFVDVAKVDGELVVAALFLERMRNFNPIVNVRHVFDGRFAVDFALHRT